MALIDDLREIEQTAVSGVEQIAKAGIGAAGDVAGGAVGVAQNALQEVLDLVRQVLGTVAGDDK